MSILNNELIKDFILKNEIDKRDALHFMSEFRLYISKPNQYELSYDGNVVSLLNKKIDENHGLFYLEKAVFKNEVKLTDLDIKHNPSKLEVINYVGQSKKGFYLVGKNGVGKTALSVALSNYHFDKTHEKTLFVFWPDFIEKTKRFNSDNINYINKVKYSKRLIIDDLGQESISGWSRDDILSSIITYRLEHKLYTVITSNYKIEELKQLYCLKSIESKKALALCTKIEALCTPLLIVGENYRK